MFRAAGAEALRNATAEMGTNFAVIPEAAPAAPVLEVVPGAPPTCAATVKEQKRAKAKPGVGEPEGIVRVIPAVIPAAPAGSAAPVQLERFERQAAASVIE